MVKAILFDFWGTLVENGIWSPIKQVKHFLDVRLPFSEYVVRMERAMMTEEFETLKDAFKRVCQEFDVPATDDLLDQLVGLWNKNWMLAEPYEDTVKVLKKLKKNYKVILVSNSDCFGISKVMEKFKLKGLFDKTFLSCEVGMIKTDENFLKKVVDELGISVEDCLLVGDSMHSDIMAAKKTGMKAVLIDRRDTRDYAPKIKSLTDLEGIVEK